MTAIAVRAEGISKQYRLGGSRTALRAIRDRVHLGPSPQHTAGSPRQPETIWALRDLSFELAEGEALGIVGRNGAGKSTLLKILSQITHPTTGRAVVRGRVGALLEVGTGFHPELTGRENVYLNGAFLGMRRSETQRKFDEIIDFADIGAFVDTPVKRYSTGMFMRLAFSVAAHLEPDILIVDEVLAVGDAAFQRKCLGQMSSVARQGRTVLFVSHNMAAVAGLCSRGLLLDRGRCTLDGPIEAVVREYIAQGPSAQADVSWSGADGPQNDRVALRRVRVLADDAPAGEVDIDRDTVIEITYECLQPDLRLATSIHLRDEVGVEVLASANFASANLVEDAWFDQPHPVGTYVARCVLPARLLNDREYSISVLLLSNVSTVEVRADDVVRFRVHDSGAMRQEFRGHWIGVVRPPLAWTTTAMAPTSETRG